jgi:hypothetical protein
MAKLDLPVDTENLGGGVPKDALERMPPQAHEDLMATIRTGDIFLCSGKDPFSRLIQYATCSPWSHVAMALRLGDVDEPIVLEAVQKIGVRAVRLNTFLSQASDGTKPYPGRILLARHHGLQALADEARMRRMTQFAIGRMGAPFAGGEMVKIALRIVMGRFDMPTPRILLPKDEFICSEYVARCFHAAGVDIPWDGLGFIAPSDFAADPSVEALAQVKTL